VRTPVALVDGEQTSELARWVGLLDTANGIAVRESPETWLFPNVDPTLHLHRLPVGPWLGLDIQAASAKAASGSPTPSSMTRPVPSDASLRCSRSAPESPLRCRADK